MRIAVQADDGDEVSIAADFLSIEQALVTLEIENLAFNEFDSVTLSIEKARELANALLAVAESIETASGPPAEFLGLRDKRIAAAAAGALAL
jgi:hypothetical protein